MELDGNLKVTGTVESTTIDSLKQVIADLQTQLAALQGAGVLQTRVYELPRYTWNSATSMNINLTEITGYDLNFAKVEIVKVSDHYTDNPFGAYVRLQASSIRDGSEIWAGMKVLLEEPSSGTVQYGQSGMTYIVYDGNNGIRIYTSGYGNGGDDGGSGWADIIISVTAEFPILGDGDVNNDGSYNVLDIVELALCVLNDNCPDEI